ncbi:glucan endo-1,3-beta-glucosidase 8-like [Gossypium hirsutum]|uniref:Glucan endo-1,3-beta-glucosidase 8-like n=1 Tax=Gossypium hirsutum TaxID=3635 RepID=A0ABM2YVA2_GOSHI|nr:glucan endo-1,3-beta-glucosidase 8-like [Gossypium hirsutum]
MAKNEGTPLRLKQYPDVYIFSLLDEDLKSIDPGMFERHWGIFSFDGQPKFPMDLSGKGQNKPLVGGKNVTYMEKKWCVYNKDASNQKDLLVKVAWACNNTDCTTLVPGASCSGMGIDMNASVAFNMYYQMANQTKGACDFDGLAKIVKRDPSNGTCRFPIMIKTIQTTSNSTASAPKSSRSSTFSSSTSHSPFETHSPSPSSSPFHSPLLIFQIFYDCFGLSDDALMCQYNCFGLFNDALMFHMIASVYPMMHFCASMIALVYPMMHLGASIFASDFSKMHYVF